MKVKKVSWDDFFRRLEKLKIDYRGAIVYGVPKGGMIASGFLHNARNVHDPIKAHYILDDIVDSGSTRQKYKDKFSDAAFLSIVDKQEEGITGWVSMPWEEDHPGGPDSIEENVVRILQYIGEDPARPGLLETPSRVARSWKELTSGYDVDVPSLFKVFDEGHDEMVILNGIQVTSLCEHHLLPFSGTVSVGYLPNQGRVIGLSKIARVVKAYGRRLQVQERLTAHIAGAFMNHLQPMGVGVVVKAKHSCMSLRGVQDGGSEMVTSCLRGNFKTDPTVRAEFLRLIEL